LTTNQEFLSSLKTKFSARERELEMLSDYLKTLKLEIAKEASFIQQVEAFIEKEESGESRLPKEVSALLAAHRERTISIPSQVQTGASTRNRRIAATSTTPTDSDHIRAHAPDVLARAGRVLSGPEILAAIEADGYVFRSKNPSELIKKALKNAPAVVRRGRGYWLPGVELPNVEAEVIADQGRKRRRA
jgi:hypothetical protein